MVSGACPYQRLGVGGLNVLPPVLQADREHAADSNANLSLADLEGVDLEHGARDSDCRASPASPGRGGAGPPGTGGSGEGEGLDTKSCTDYWVTGRAGLNTRRIAETFRLNWVTKFLPPPRSP